LETVYESSILASALQIGDERELMSKKYCSQCGRELGDAVKFCSECGASVAPVADTKAKTKNTKNTQLRDILIIAGILALTVVVFLIVTDQPEIPQPQQSGMMVPPGHEDGIPESMLADAPKDFNSLVSMGNRYMDEGNYALAAELYRRALEIDGSSPNLRTDFGSCLHGMGLPERALEEFRKVIISHPNHAIANFNTGIVFQALQNADSAKYYWQKYLTLDPNGQAAGAAKQFLQEAGG